MAKTEALWFWFILNDFGMTLESVLAISICEIVWRWPWTSFRVFPRHVGLSIIFISVLLLRLYGCCHCCCRKYILPIQVSSKTWVQLFFGWTYIYFQNTISIYLEQVLPAINSIMLLLSLQWSLLITTLLLWNQNVSTTSQLIVKWTS